MKAIIEKQVTILPANSGFVSKSDTGREPCIVIIKLFSNPDIQKRSNYTQMSFSNSEYGNWVLTLFKAPSRK